jgi:hypothetical protein
VSVIPATPTAPAPARRPGVLTAAIGGGVALLVFGLLMRKAATWTRVLVTISAALTIVFSLIIVGDETTPTMAGLAMLAMLGGIVAIVLTWLPANGRYAKATA